MEGLGGGGREDSRAIFGGASLFEGLVQPRNGLEALGVLFREAIAIVESFFLLVGDWKVREAACWVNFCDVVGIDDPSEVSSVG